MIKNKDNSSVYFILLFLVIIINSIGSTFFITIFLSGVVFEIFIQSLEKKNLYRSIFSIICFLFIEVVLGLPLFIFSLISLFIYYILLQKIKLSFSSDILAQLTYIFIFYFLFFLIMAIINHYDFTIYKIFIYNFILDSIIIGLFV